MRTRLLCLGLFLFLLSPVSHAWAGAQPHMSSAFQLVSPTGQRFSLTSRTSSDTTIDATGAPTTVTEVVLEVETAPGNPDRQGQRGIGNPNLAVMQGATTGSAWNPSLAGVLFLVAKGYVTTRDVSDQLGFAVTVTRARGGAAAVKDPATDAIVLGLLLAQLQAADPAAALAMSRMIGNPDFFPAGLTLPAPVTTR